MKNSNIDIFLDDVSPTVMKLDTKVLYGLAFQAMRVSLTFIQDHDHKGLLENLHKVCIKYLVTSCYYVNFAGTAFVLIFRLVTSI